MSIKETHNIPIRALIWEGHNVDKNQNLQFDSNTQYYKQTLPFVESAFYPSVPLLGL